MISEIEEGYVGSLSQKQSETVCDHDLVVVFGVYFANSGQISDNFGHSSGDVVCKRLWHRIQIVETKCLQAKCTHAIDIQFF